MLLSDKLFQIFNFIWTEIKKGGKYKEQQRIYAWKSFSSQDSSTVISTNSGDMKQTKSSIMSKKDEKKYTNRIREASKSAGELSEKLKVTEESARRIKELAEDIQNLNEGENDIKLSTDSKMQYMIF